MLSLLLILAGICLQRIGCYRSAINNYTFSKRSNANHIEVTNRGVLYSEDVIRCYSKGEKGIYDYDCRSAVYGGVYMVKYCGFYKRRILADFNSYVEEQCADAYNWYCKAVSQAGIYHHKCTPHCGGLCSRTTDGHDYTALCGLNGGSIADWLKEKPGHEGAYHACMKHGPYSFCKAVKLLGKYEADCVKRIPHRDKYDDYCTCKRLGSVYYDGKKTYRCNEKQNPNNPMDLWDNECLRECYSKNTLGWMCTPYRGRLPGMKSKLKPFGHRPEVLDDIIAIETAKKKGQPVSMGHDGKVHVVREDSPEAAATIKRIEAGKRAGLTVKMNEETGEPTFHQRRD